jgi:hypothetical protein
VRDGFAACSAVRAGSLALEPLDATFRTLDVVANAIDLRGKPACQCRRHQRRGFFLQVLAQVLLEPILGTPHDLQQDEDARREKALRELGLRIVRVRNDEVVKDLSTVVGKIQKQIS